eukprot:6485549-Amphidinium_carterae.1
MVRHAPFNSEQWFVQCREALDEYLLIGDASTCPLFSELLPRLCRDYGVEHSAGDTHASERMWETLSHGKSWTHAGTAVNLTRWFSLITAGREDDQHWHSRLLAQLYYCIESDLLSGKPFLKYLESRCPSFARPQQNSRRMADESSEQRNLRAACANTLVVATMVRADQQNQSLERLVTGVVEPVERWLKESNKRLRSTTTVVSWLVEQQTGGVKKVLGEVAGLMHSATFLRRIGLSKGHPQVLQRAEQSLTAQEQLDGAIKQQDDVASHLGDLVLRLLGTFNQSLLHLTEGWPNACAKWLDDRGADTSKFLSDVRLFRDLCDQKHSSLATAMAERSQFQTMSMQQVVQVIESDLEGNELSDGSARWLRDVLSKFMQSQVAEDGFNDLRRVEKATGNRRPSIERFAIEQMTNR